LSGWRDPHGIALPQQQFPCRAVAVSFRSFGKPQRQTALLQEMAALGHRAINLCYPNDWTIGQLCAAPPTATATKKCGRRSSTAAGPTC
jgi:hypothetical protein